MSCACSICRGDFTKPTGCRCKGERHASMLCFVTPPPAIGTTVADYLSTLGLADVRAALKELIDRRRLDPQPRVSPLKCGCHCSGGCGDPYAACMYPCAEHVPF